MWDSVGVTCSSVGILLSDYCINLSSLHFLCKVKQVVTKCLFHLLNYHEKCTFDLFANGFYPLRANTQHSKKG